MSPRNVRELDLIHPGGFARLLGREPDAAELTASEAPGLKMLLKGKPVDPESLKMVVESLALLRRDFEGQLLAGPGFEQPKKPEISEKG